MTKALPPGQKKRGAKGKYTPDIVDKICQFLASGNYVETSCALVGIHPDTFYEWKNRYPEFSDAVDRAQASSEATSVVRIRNAAKGGEVAQVDEVIHPDGTVERTTKYRLGDWKADAWFLGHAFPKRWGNQVSVTGSNGGPVEVAIRPGAVRSIRELFRAGNNSGSTPGVGGEGGDTD